MTKSSASAISRATILNGLRATQGKSLHVMELLQVLSLPKGARDEVREHLLELKELGMAKELPGGRFRYEKSKPNPPPQAETRKRKEEPRRAEPAPKRSAAPATRDSGARARTRSDGGYRRFSGPLSESNERTTGVLSATDRGFAFVLGDDGLGEIFVPPDSLRGAIQGDLVELAFRASARGREGAVLNVIERRITRATGTLRRDRDGFFLEPHSRKLDFVVRIEGAMPLDAKEGADVVAQILPNDVPALGSVLLGKVIRVLGKRGSAAVEIDMIKVAEQVNEEFSADVLREAAGFSPRVSLDEIALREDLRHMEIVTIDPDDAKDHDDAMWAMRTERGYRVLVAIADVSHYVSEGSAIDKEAMQRGCSIYLPGRVIPMLPFELSSNLASLVPGEDRLTLAVEVNVSREGKVREYRFVSGVMRSRARLSYGGVARALGWTNEPPVQEAAEARKDQLELFAEISGVLRAERNRRGSLNFDLPETKILLDDQGEPAAVVGSRTDPGVKRAYEVIEDFMLLANEVVAGHTAREKIPAIYRIHGAPDQKKLFKFLSVLDALGVDVSKELDAGDDERTSPHFYRALLKKIEGHPQEQVLVYLLLRSMQQAQYSVHNIGHFALAARDYLHFTSPIRRYPDLVVHRTLRAIIAKERLRPDALSKMIPQAVQASRMERRAMNVEREVAQVYKCILMQRHVGEQLPGRVTGVSLDGIVVQLDTPFVEVRVSADKLPGVFELDELGIALVKKRGGGAIRIGDIATVQVTYVSVEKREVAGELVSLKSAVGKTQTKPAKAKSPDAKKSRTTRAPKQERPRGKPSKSRR